MASFSFRKTFSLLGLEIKASPHTSVLSKIVTSLTSVIRKYDINWYVRFLKMGREEDEAQGQSVTDPFKQIAWVNIAVSKRSENIARPPYRLYSGENLVETGSVYDLFRHVNPYMSRYQLFEATNSWLDIRGECFWLFEPDLVGVPHEIWLPNPSHMKARLDSNNQISLWLYEVGKERIPYLPDQLIHFKLWNPWNAYRGIQPLIALDTELSAEYLASISNLNMIRNGSVPDGLLSSEQNISPEKALELKKIWLDNHKGARKAHTISVLGQGTKYQQIQMTPADMEYFTMKKWSRETILARHGIPAVLASITDSPATLSGDDTRDQLKVFWNLSLIPRLRFIEQKVDTDFFDRYGLKLTGKFDLTEIAELQEDEVKKRIEERLDLLAGIGTINRVLERRGEEPVPWGNVWWAPFSLTPVEDSIVASATIEEPKASTPIAFWDKPKIASLEKAKPTYTLQIKKMHWKVVINSWEAIERGYTKEIKAWLFEQRSQILEIITREKAVGSDLLDEITDNAYWVLQDEQLKQLSKVWFRRAVEESEGHIRQLVESIGLPSIEASWSIFDTRAVEMLDLRITAISRVTDTVKKGVKVMMQDAIRDGLSEGDAAQSLRDTYNVFQNRTPTIARTEIGGVLNDSRIETYKHFGWKKHEWLSSADGVVRTPGEPKGNIFDHKIDGEIVDIETRFSNDLLWPNELGAAAGNVINCRCLTVPITEE